MFVPTGDEMEALEIGEDARAGYCFAVLGALEADAWELFQLLYAKCAARSRPAMSIAPSLAGS